MRSLVGDMPPGVDAERITGKLRKECMDECTDDIEEHVDEAAACLDVEDCSDYLHCIEAIDES